jgi:CheY-like chemotaxis protein
MDESLKSLLRELGEAINEAVTGSPRVAEVIQAIRNQGYDIVLTLDVNIAVADNRKPAGAAPQPPAEGGLTAADRRFLKRLKIDY